MDSLAQRSAKGSTVKEQIALYNEINYITKQKNNVYCLYVKWIVFNVRVQVHVFHFNMCFSFIICTCAYMVSRFCQNTYL